MGLYGLGPVGSARLLADVGNIARFPTRARFASWNGAAPIDASSGRQVRHRLSRAGNRRINRVLHIMAIVRIRHDTAGRTYYRRKLAAGKPRWKPCGASSAAGSMSSTASLPQTCSRPATHSWAASMKRIREDTWGRLSNPVRPA
jgi:transposase